MIFYLYVFLQKVIKKLIPHRLIWFINENLIFRAIQFQKKKRAALKYSVKFKKSFRKSQNLIMIYNFTIRSLILKMLEFAFKFNFDLYYLGLNWINYFSFEHPLLVPFLSRLKLLFPPQFFELRLWFCFYTKFY